MDLSQEQVRKMLMESKRGSRPNILFKNSTQLEREVLEQTSEVIDFQGSKVVAEVLIEQVTTKTITIRAYDPTKSYADAIQEFIDPQTPQKGDDT